MVVRVLENSIHPDEWNADAADYADTRGFGVVTPGHLTIPIDEKQYIGLRV